jgi:hypothetical protein
LKWRTEGRLQKYVQQHSLNVYYSVYTSLHIFNPPDQGKAVEKLLKHLMSTFRKKGIETVAYPGILFGGVQQIQLRTEVRENGDMGAVAPYSGVLETAVIWYFGVGVEPHKPPHSVRHCILRKKFSLPRGFIHM